LTTPCSFRQLQYFDELTIDKVTEAKLADYVDWRLSQQKQPAVVTLKNERTAIRQLLKFAKRKGYISEVPEFAIKSGRINARPDIPEREWHRLTRFLPGYVDRAQDKRRQRERFYLALYILILGNTGIRIGEARRLRWTDVSSTRTLTDEVRAVLLPRQLVIYIQFRSIRPKQIRYIQLGPIQRYKPIQPVQIQPAQIRD
jgi:integrase